VEDFWKVGEEIKARIRIESLPFELEATKPYKLSKIGYQKVEKHLKLYGFEAFLFEI
jgi:hypothetical protein